MTLLYGDADYRYGFSQYDLNGDSMVDINDVFKPFCQIESVPELDTGNNGLQLSI
jgi:hypothetical protein